MTPGPELCPVLSRHAEQKRLAEFGLERKLQELADADSDELAAGVTPAQAWAIGQAMVAGLEIYQRLAPGLVTPEVFERAIGLLADIYEEQ
jgi:hypothetical protein